MQDILVNGGWWVVYAHNASCVWLSDLGQRIYE